MEANMSGFGASKYEALKEALKKAIEKDSLALLPKDQNPYFYGADLAKTPDKSESKIDLNKKELILTKKKLEEIKNSLPKTELISISAKVNVDGEERVFNNIVFI